MENVIKRLGFSECEHYGDLHNYLDDVRASFTSGCFGILESNINEDNETCYAYVEFASEAAWKSFLERFSKTESADFCYQVPRE